MQSGLFPLRVHSLAPSRFDGKDLKQVARTSDGHEFAVKWASDGLGIAASEWLGYRLAQACQIAVPYSAVLVNTAGSLGFGSRIERNTVQWNTLTMGERSAVFDSCGQAMSAVIALDIFCGNVDRHGNNWLFSKNSDQKWVPFCIDFSRSLFARRFPNDPWPIGPCATTSTQAALKSTGHWDGPYAVFTLEQLQRVTGDTLEHWCQDCPDEWLAASAKASLVTWWRSSEYHSRLQRSFELI